MSMLIPIVDESIFLSPEKLDTVLTGLDHEHDPADSSLHEWLSEKFTKSTGVVHTDDEAVATYLLDDAAATRHTIELPLIYELMDDLQEAYDNGESAYGLDELDEAGSARLAAALLADPEPSTDFKKPKLVHSVGEPEEPVVTGVDLPRTRIYLLDPVIEELASAVGGPELHSYKPARPDYLTLVPSVD